MKGIDDFAKEEHSKIGKLKKKIDELGINSVIQHNELQSEAKALLVVDNAFDDLITRLNLRRQQITSTIRAAYQEHAMRQNRYAAEVQVVNGLWSSVESLSATNQHLNFVVHIKELERKVNSFPLAVTAKAGLCPVDLENLRSQLENCGTVVETQAYGKKMGKKGRLRNPRCVARTGDMLLIAEIETNRISCMNLWDRSMSRIIVSPAKGGGGKAELAFPSGMCVEAPFLYVSERDNHRVSQFQLGTWKHVRNFGSGKDNQGGALRSPHGLTCAQQMLVVADSGNHTVKAFALGDGQLVRSFGGRKGQQLPGELDEPTGVAVIGNRVFVADRGTTRVHVFDFQTGVVERILFGAAASLTVKSCKYLSTMGDFLVVSDARGGRVLVLAVDPGSEGRVMHTFTEGPGKHSLNFPHGLCVCPDYQPGQPRGQPQQVHNGWTIFVADDFNHRVVSWRLS